jgi:hypothetical protein
LPTDFAAGDRQYTHLGKVRHDQANGFHLVRIDNDGQQVQPKKQADAWVST